MSGVSRRVIARTVVTKLLAEPSRQEYWLKALAAYLVAHNRTNEAELLINDILHELFEQDGHLAVQVTSARPLSDAVRSALKDALKRQTNARRIDMTEAVDPSLIGGLIARTPDATLDASVRAKLNTLATIK